MPRSRRLALAVGALALGAFVLTLSGGPRALAKGKKEETLRYAKSWVEAVTEARSRNAVLFATFHKDN